MELELELTLLPQIRSLGLLTFGTGPLLSSPGLEPIGAGRLVWVVTSATSATLAATTLQSATNFLSSGNVLSTHD